MTINELREAIEELLVGTGDRPIVAFIAFWPFLRVLDGAKAETAQNFLNMLLEIAGSRTLIMPSFITGYKDGVCDLDTAPSTAGIISEMFRQRPTARRNLSAFFPYAIEGEARDEFAELLPEHAWGDGSTYEWMENQDVSFLMLGTHPTHCSYLHRMEWLARHLINYRYIKRFDGTIIREGKRHEVTEHLYVRSLQPELINDFTAVEGALEAGGMSITKFGGVHLAHMTAQKMRDACLPLLLKDPFVTVKNKSDFQHNDNHQQAVAVN
jgi:aminoglycoside N3'-acetyltransferase